MIIRQFPSDGPSSGSRSRHHGRSRLWCPLLFLAILLTTGWGLVVPSGLSSQAVLHAAAPVSSEALLERHARTLGSEKSRVLSRPLRLEGQREFKGTVRPFAWTLSPQGGFLETSSGNRYSEALAWDGARGWQTLPNGVTVDLLPGDAQLLQFLALLLSGRYTHPVELGLSLGRAREDVPARVYELPFVGGSGLSGGLEFRLQIDARSWHLQQAVLERGGARVVIELAGSLKWDGRRLPEHVFIRLERGEAQQQIHYHVRELVEEEGNTADRFRFPSARPQKLFFPEDATRVEIPVRFHSGAPWPLLRLSLLGEEPSWFLLDTGADLTVIDARLADELRLPVLDRVLEEGARTLTVRELLFLRRATLGDLELRDTVVTSADLSGLRQSTGVKVEGILGADVLGDAVVSFFLESQRVAWTLPALFEPGPELVPLELDGRRRVKAAMEGHSGTPPLLCLLLVDTGSELSLSLSEHVAALGGLDPPAEQRTPTRMGRLGETFEAYAGAIPALHLGNFRVEAVPTVFVKEGGPGARPGELPEGLLGNEFLRRYPFSVDLAGRTLWLDSQAIHAGAR